MNGVLQQMANRLDLAKAQEQAAISNDLLPPREDDHVTGELGKRFVAHLKKALEEGRYEPDTASFIQVPKPGFTSRPAALLTLTDRVVYEGLIDLLRRRLARYLISSDVVFWPRESYVDKRWPAFERAPLEGGHEYIVQADVSGFYDSIDHEQLEDLLVHATGEREVSRAIKEFLARVMSSRRGLPQGLLPSDTLATTFLQPVDAALVREGYDYWRHGDDVRIAAATVSRAREAIATLEVLLRQQGLLVNGAKCAIIKRAAYASELAAGDALIKATREKLVARSIRKLKASDEDLTEAMKEAELDEQWGWDLFYHHTVSIDEVIDILREHLEPSDVDIAAQVFVETMKRAPGGRRALGAEQFHQQLTRSLLRLAAGRSPVALEHAASIAARFPDKTDLVAGYLVAMQKTHAMDAVRQAEDVVTSGVFTTPWQQAWLCRVLARGIRHVAKKTLEALTVVASNEGTHWLARVEAMKVLGRAKTLERELVVRSWKLAPRPYRCDLIAATASMRTSHDWAKRFLDAARQDPVEAVVVKHVGRSRDG